MAQPVAEAVDVYWKKIKAEKGCGYTLYPISDTENRFGTALVAVIYLASINAAERRHSS